MAASCGQGLRRFSRIILSKKNVILPKEAKRVNTFDRSRILKQHQCTYCTGAESSPRSWNLLSAVCVERYPVISHKLNEIEQEFQDMCDAMECEASRLSEHEIQVQKDRDRLKKRQDGELEEFDDDADIITALDFEDLETERLNQFQPSARETEADKSNDMRSLDRKLSDKLVLLVQAKFGESLVWILPQGLRSDGESLRETAERVLSSYSNENQTIQVEFSGNSPVGIYKYKYPQDLQNKLGAQGAKIFFFKAKLKEGKFESSSDTDIRDYKWLTREELDSHLLKAYSDSVKQFILPTSW